MEVLPYSTNELKKYWAHNTVTIEDVVVEKVHLKYFQNYFAAIKTSTLVFEPEYTDKDFLIDYSAYYVRSFRNYDRRCARLHFFKNSFTIDHFKNILRGEPSDLSIAQLQDNYQGFIVLKPLPVTIIGKTCLVTYEHEGRRFFPCIRNYDVNLFGLSLKVNSIAYQEQDSIVAACASSAIWSVFHATAILFQHALPSPAEITNSVLVHFPFSNRNFPNKGLSGEQMALTIREVGLDPYLFKTDSYDTVKATIYAYLKGKIPVTLGFSLWDLKGNNAGDPPTTLGRHAVAVLGYSLGGALKSSFDSITDLTLLSSCVDKVYVHDDQIGPFAKMDFTNFVLNIAGKQIPAIDTTWANANNEIGKIKAVPEILIIPLYHKIRIPFDNILKIINEIKQIQVLINKAPGLPNFTLLEWDIFLSNVTDFKKDILDNNSIATGDYKESLLIQRFPKYLWRAIGMNGANRKIEFIFDATDIDQGEYYLRYIVYDNVTADYFKVIAPLVTASDLNVKAILKSFII